MTTIYDVIRVGTDANLASINPAGKVIEFADGIYSAGIHVLPSFAGTAERPTVLRAENRWQARIMNAAGGHGIYVARGADHVVIDGFDVASPLWDGVKTEGRFTTIHNCWIHKNQGQGILSNGWRTIVDGCLVEGNGGDPQWTHGIYPTGEGCIIRGCIIRHNGGQGISAISQGSQQRGLIVCDNLIYGNGGSQIYVTGNVAGRQAPITIDHNTIIGGRDPALSVGVYIVEPTVQVSVTDNIITSPIGQMVEKRVTPNDVLKRPARVLEAGNVVAVDERDLPFRNAYRGDYRLAAGSPYTDSGWPLARQPVSDLDWARDPSNPKSAKWPYANAHQIGRYMAPLSLFPEVPSA